MQKKSQRKTMKKMLVSVFMAAILFSSVCLADTVINNNSNFTVSFKVKKAQMRLAVSDPIFNFNQTVVLQPHSSVSLEKVLAGWEKQYEDCSRYDVYEYYFTLSRFKFFRDHAEKLSDKKRGLLISGFFRKSSVSKPFVKNIRNIINGNIKGRMSKSDISISDDEEKNITDIIKALLAK